jgi:uncharacterized protein involved in response to NO
MKPSGFPPVVLQSGFRVFFLGAVIYSVVSMAVWLYFYVAGGNIFVAMPLTVWHAHEMVFGFTLAVVAGFLLTAVSNWTSLPTIHGLPLLGLFSVWSLARIFAFFPSSFSLWPLMACNLLFTLWLFGIVLMPILKVRQWKQSAVLSKLLMILICEVVFYGALLHSDLVRERIMLKFAVYMIISLILTIGRRIIPFFVEKGVGYPVTLNNSRFLDYSSVVLLVLLSVLDVFFQFPSAVSGISLLLVLIHSLRIKGWYTHGILSKPLLWVLFCGYMFIILGFALKVMAMFSHRFDDAALHAWTSGGIGIFIIGMMARVSWGHTGRNISDPPHTLGWIFLMIILGSVFRMFFTLLFDAQYIVWIGVSQVLWIAAYGMFLITYAPVLISARIDGKPG